MTREDLVKLRKVIGKFLDDIRELAVIASDYAFALPYVLYQTFKHHHQAIKETIVVSLHPSETDARQYISHHAKLLAHHKNRFN